MVEAESDRSLLGIVLVHSHAWKSIKEYARYSRVKDPDSEKMVKVVDEARTNKVQIERARVQ
jgi:hypothetical protein